MPREADLNAKGYSEKAEKRIMNALGRGLLKEFPNPERIGCPGSEVLKRIASRTMPLAEAEKWLDHLGSCSPCYSDLSQFRKVQEIRRQRTLLAVAASILIVASIAGWALLRRHNEAPDAQVAVLDLRNRSVARGTEPNPEEPPLDVNRFAKQWNIFLPLGSSEGSYDVRIVAPSGDSLVATSGTATLADHITSLLVSVSLSSARPEKYLLQIRKAGSDWNSYALVLR